MNIDFEANNPTHATTECYPNIFKSEFSEGVNVAFPIFIIGNSYKTKLVCSLFGGVQNCQITKPFLCCKGLIWITKGKKNYHPKKWRGQSLPSPTPCVVPYGETAHRGWSLKGSLGRGVVAETFKPCSF